MPSNKFVQPARVLVTAFEATTVRLFLGLALRYLSACLTVSAIFLSFSLQAVSAQEVKDIRIGVRANRGAEQAFNRWQATADYLTTTLPGYRFILVPFEINSTLNQAVSRGEFDFVLTNPAAYVELEMRYGVRRLVTLINKRRGQGYTQFGSVIFTRKDRTDIQTLADLRGKTFMGVDELGFGGWRVAWRELLHHGIHPYKDLAVLSFGGGIQQNVVYAVAKGEVDAGSVRTDILERLAQSGKIELSEFKVLGARATKAFDFLHSTPLYPEWPLAKLAHTDDALAERVATALLHITEASPAAVSGKYVGWHTPLDYQPVHDLLKELRVGPYARMQTISISAFVAQYWHIVTLTLMVLLFFVFMSMRMSRLNKQLLVTEQGLLESNLHLRGMTVIDGLTGVGNRRKLDEFLANNWGQVCRNAKPVCVMLLDIDYFKKYNDTYGHIAGDDCLKKIAGTISHLYRRSGELVIRYGGEEFLIMVVDCEPMENHVQVEQLRQEIENLHIEHRASDISEVVTASIGVVTVTPNKDSVAEELIQAADLALYQAKRGGRNRVYWINP